YCHPQRDAPERQTIAQPRFGLLAAHDLVAGSKPFGGQDVAFFTVGVTHQRNPARAVRIVLNGDDFRPRGILVALEVDNPVHSLVAAAAEPRARVALVVPSPLALVRRDQALFRFLAAIGQLREIADARAPATGGDRFVVANTHNIPRGSS